MLSNTYTARHSHYVIPIMPIFICTTGRPLKDFPFKQK